MEERLRQLRGFAKQYFDANKVEFADTIDVDVRDSDTIFKTRETQFSLRAMHYNDNVEPREFSKLKGLTNIIINLPYNIDIEIQKEVLERKIKKAWRLFSLLSEPVDGIHEFGTYYEDVITI